MQLVIPVYDKYHYILDIFLNILVDKWKNCPCSILVLCGKREYKPKINKIDIQVKTLGNEYGWASNMIHCLDFIEDVFMLSLEDCFLTKSPNSDLFNMYWNIMLCDNSIGFFCLQPRWLKPKKHINKYYWEFLPGEKYAVNFQMSFWRKQTLGLVLREGQNAWESELKGTKKAWQIMREKHIKFLCVYEKYKPVDYVIALTKGKWNKKAKKMGRSSYARS